MENRDRIRDMVMERYGRAAAQVQEGGGGCCGGKDPKSLTSNAISRQLYSSGELGGLPDKAVLASLGCANPTALAELKPGEVVLDLGSGGGIDVLLSARRVGPTGKAYGLDMTDEMLALARENQRQAGVGNAEFIQGTIEDIPLPANSVDVIISNCVINLSTDKDRVLREAFRVLKPGGRLAIADIVHRGDVPESLRRAVEAWVGCLAGTMEESEYRAKLAAAGFTGVDLETVRVYGRGDLCGITDIPDWAGEMSVSDLLALDGKFASVFVRAEKPGS